MQTWLSGVISLTDIAKRHGEHRTTLSRRFRLSSCAAKKIPLRRLPPTLVLVLDGTTIATNRIALIIYEVVSRQPLMWAFVRRENYETWCRLLQSIAKKYSVAALVSDGQKGLKKAIVELFSHTPHQRCVAHVVRLALAKLTKHPQSDAGQALRSLVCALRFVKTTEDAACWSASVLRWNILYITFLAERSMNPTTRRMWYTHRKLRAVRSLILHALPNLFYYTTNAEIPNTTNHVEGGINARLKELLGRHRGITTTQKELLVSEFLYRRRKEKLPTRNAT